MFRSPVHIDKIVSERQMIEVKLNLNLTIVIKYIGQFFLNSTNLSQNIRKYTGTCSISLVT